MCAAPSSTTGVACPARRPASGRSAPTPDPGVTRDSETGRRRPHPVVAAAVCVVLLLAAAGLVRHFVVQPFTVPSASMQPALQPGDVILADRGERGAAQRGDIVVRSEERRVGSECGARWEP